jgi:hypothetical protein
MSKWILPQYEGMLIIKYAKSWVLNLLQPWATFTPSYGLAGSKFINENNLLKSRDNLIKTLLNYADHCTCEFLSNSRK